MNDYPFHLIRHEQEGPIKEGNLLRQRPFAEIDRSFQADARRFIPGEQLQTAINTAIAVGEP
ncbi:MAG: hypothetical protein ACE5I1_27780, partial [bacterium]